MYCSLPSFIPSLRLLLLVPGELVGAPLQNMKHNININCYPSDNNDLENDVVPNKISYFNLSLAHLADGVKIGNNFFLSGR